MEHDLVDRRDGNVQQLMGHGPVRFSLLFICSDGVDTFQALYVANRVAPKVVTVIQPGHAFGHNWTDFTDSEKVFARVVLANPAGQPDKVLYGGIGNDWTIPTDSY